MNSPASDAPDPDWDAADSDAPSVDARYTAYVSVYTTFDQLIWAIPAVMTTILALGLGVFGSALQDERTAIQPFTHAQTVGLVYVSVSVLVGLASYGMATLRIHHSRMGDHLAALEAGQPASYFIHRLSESSRRRRLRLSRERSRQASD